MKQFAIAVVLAVAGAAIDMAIRQLINPSAPLIYQWMLAFINAMIIRRAIYNQ